MQTSSSSFLTLSLKRLVVVLVCATSTHAFATTTQDESGKRAIASSGVAANTEPALESLAPVGLSAAEGIAVVRYPDRKLRTVHVGDVLGATRARVTQVLPDRLVLEEVATGGAKQTAWLFRPRRPDEGAVVQRLSGNAPAHPTASDATVTVVPIAPAVQSGQAASPSR
jgi:hypothetical protein